MGIDDPVKFCGNESAHGSHESGARRGHRGFLGKLLIHPETFAREIEFSEPWVPMNLL